MSLQEKKGKKENKYYWKIHRTVDDISNGDVYHIYTMYYDPNESFADFVKRLWIKSKMDDKPISSVKLHYHGENNRPICLEDEKDYSIYLMVQDYSKPKKGFAIFTRDHHTCYEFDPQ